MDRPRILLGQRLRALRIRADLSGPRLAEILGTSQSTISRYERAVVPAPRRLVERWLEATGATAEERTEIMQLFEKARTEIVSHREVLRGSLAGRQRELLEVMRHATRVRHFQPAMIPGVLQTADYARAVMLALRPSDEGDLEEAIEARLQRGEQLLQPDAPTYEIIVTEQALRWRTPNLAPAARGEAWRTVLRFTEAANISLRVIPADAPSPLPPMCPFIVFEADDPQPVVFLELPTVEVTLAGIDEVDWYLRAWDQYVSAALSPQKSAALLRRLLREQREAERGRATPPSGA